MSTSFTMLPMIAPPRLVTGASTRDLTHILSAFPHGSGWRATRRQRAQPSHRNSGQQPAPPPNFWARHSRELFAVSVLIAALVVLVWPNTLLPLAIAAAVLGLTMLFVLLVLLAWRRQPRH